MNSLIPPDAYVIIIGAMKCGTTTLYSYLEDHPEICPALTKEPEFFSTHQRHRRDVATYQELRNFDTTVHRYAMEASTGYTKYPTEPTVAQAIHDYGIRPKFIYLVRNPFDRIVSHFNYMNDYVSWNRNLEDSHLVHVSNYYMQLLQYRPYFPLESLLILDFDELRDRPDAVLPKYFPSSPYRQNTGRLPTHPKMSHRPRACWRRQLKSLLFDMLRDFFLLRSSPPYALQLVAFPSRISDC